MKQLLFMMFLFTAGVCKPADQSVAFTSNWKRCALRCAAVGVRSWADLKIRRYRVTTESPEKNLKKARIAYAVRALADAAFALTDPRLLHGNASIKASLVARVAAASVQLHAAIKGDLSLVKPTRPVTKLSTNGDIGRGGLALFDGLAAVATETFAQDKGASLAVGFLSMFARLVQWALMMSEVSYDEIRLAAYGFQGSALALEGMGIFIGVFRWVEEAHLRTFQLEAELRYHLNTGFSPDDSIRLRADADAPWRVVGIFGARENVPLFERPVRIFDGQVCACCQTRTIRRDDYLAVKKIYYPGLSDEELAQRPDLKEWGIHEGEQGIAHAISVHSCGHMSCRACLNQWVLQSRNCDCPTCRTVFPTQELEGIRRRAQMIDTARFRGAAAARAMLQTPQEQRALESRRQREQMVSTAEGRN